MMPEMEFKDEDKGDALYAMELTLALEKLTNQKLIQLHRVRNINRGKAYASVVYTDSKDFRCLFYSFFSSYTPSGSLFTFTRLQRGQMILKCAIS